MIEAAIRNEPALRVAVFLGVFARVAGWEAVWPRRSRRFAPRTRWPHPAPQCPATPGSTADGPHAATECGGQT